MQKRSLLYTTSTVILGREKGLRCDHSMFFLSKGLMWTRRCKSSSADERGTAGEYNVQSSKLIHPILGSGHANLVTLRLIGDSVDRLVVIFDGVTHVKRHVF